MEYLHHTAARKRAARYGHPMAVLQRNLNTREVEPKGLHQMARYGTSDLRNHPITDLYLGICGYIVNPREYSKLIFLQSCCFSL